jgi:hypothetical protein
MKGGFATAVRATVLPDLPNPELRSPEDVTRLLQETVGQVRRGELAPAVANSIGYLGSIALRSFELDLSRRLDAAEEALRERQGSVVTVPNKALTP